METHSINIVERVGDFDSEKKKKLFQLQRITSQLKKNADVDEFWMGVLSTIKRLLEGKQMIKESTL